VATIEHFNCLHSDAIGLLFAADWLRQIVCKPREQKEREKQNKNKNKKQRNKLTTSGKHAPTHERFN